MSRERQPKLAGKSQMLERAARLTYDGRMTETAIAAELGIARRTLVRWKASPEFRALIEQHREAARVVEIQHTIADRQKRVGLLERRRHMLQEGFERIIRERGGEMAGVPGGASGLLARQYRQIGSGEFAEKVEEYKIDGGIIQLSEELRALERQAAQELGQWQADQGGEGEDQGFTLLDIAVLMRAAQVRVRTGGAYGAGEKPSVKTSTTKLIGTGRRPGRPRKRAGAE